LTVADIVSEARTSRESFYGLFRSKEDAFLAVQAASLQESISAAAGEFFGGVDWPERVWSGLKALLTFVGEHPDLAWVNLVELYSAGPAAIGRSFDNEMAYTLFLEDGYRQRPEAAALPRLSSEAIGGAIMELMRRQATRGKSKQMLELLPQVVYVALAPFIGPQRAIETVEQRLAA
jgi:AcrR family transcriptional regulator